MLIDDAEPEPASIEAPFIFRKGDYYYLFVSWDHCCRGVNSDYKVVVGRARNITGPYVDANDERLDKGGGTLLIAGNARWPGIGHNSVYTFDGRDYFVAHAYDARDRGWSKLKILELQWNDRLAQIALGRRHESGRIRFVHIDTHAVSRRECDW